MLTELYLLDRPELAASAEQLRERAASFGEGLQLVNILKDAPSDAQEGRVYLPPGVELPRAAGSGRPGPDRGRRIRRAVAPRLDVARAHQLQRVHRRPGADEPSGALRPGPGRQAVTEPRSPPSRPRSRAISPRPLPPARRSGSRTPTDVQIEDLSPVVSSGLVLTVASSGWGRRMRVFLTGATGFIGSHVARALVARGESLRCLCRRTSPRSDLRGPADRLDPRRPHRPGLLAPGHDRSRGGVPLRGRLPPLRPRPAGDLPQQRRRNAERAGARRRARRQPDRLHQLGRHPGARREPARQRERQGAARAHGRRLQAQQVPRRAAGGDLDRSRPSRRGGEPLDADRRRGRQADAHREDRRRLPQRPPSRLRRHRPESGRRARRGPRTPAGRRAGAPGRKLHPRRREPHLATGAPAARAA